MAEEVEAEHNRLEAFAGGLDKDCLDVQFKSGAASRDAEVAELKKDAMRYRMVREYMVSERIDLDDKFVYACSTNEKLDAFVDDFLAP